jgi:putative DNA primase/helicase
MPRRVKPQKDGSESADPRSLRGARPWGNFAKKYFDAGWCPLPLPPRRKKSPPTGTTGKYDMPNEKKIAGWSRQRDPRGNIAIRVPDDIIGIDVDAYDAKVGYQSLARLEEEFGPLPPSWTLTSRTDGVSGIRFFRVPSGLHWPGEPLPDVQIVQHHHRYAVAYPSVHPDTRGLYLWYAPGDELNGKPSITIEHEIPLASEIDKLPTSWVEGLTAGKLWQGLDSDANATRQDILDWLKARPAGEMCRLMRKQAAAAVEEVSVGGAHDSLNSRAYAIVSLASEGHSGVLRALRDVRDAFYAEVTQEGRKGRRSRPEAVSEFSRVRDGAVRIMMASVADGESGLESECGCAGNSLDWGEKLGVVVDDSPVGVGAGGTARARLGKAKAPDKYTFDDSGNAEHMLDILDGAAYFLPGEKSWYFWDPSCGAWQADPFGSRALQAAQLVGKRCRELSDEYMERLKAAGSSVTLDTGGDVAAKIAQLDKHAKVSSDRKGLESMVKIAGAQARAERAIEVFNAHPTLLACSNGTVVLGPEGVSFRAANRDDLLSLSTGVPFDPTASSAAWVAYLEKFLPDVEVRRYVQKVAGYTLLGANPERKLFFMQGGTSTGKTTFVNAFTEALGQYAGTMNLSLFRDFQDEKPRPDLFKGLGKRLLAASEASAEWHLHGDQVKRLTGGDTIKARLLNSNTYAERKPAFAPWIATNVVPHFHGIDKALYRRLVFIPWRQTVAEGAEDFTISLALSSAEGRCAVLAWAVAGWELYRADGGLREPQAVQEATHKLLGEMSDLDRFLREMTTQGASEWVRFDDLFQRWELWADDNRIDEKMSKTRFGMELAGRGFESDVKKLRGKTVRVRKGLSLVKNR